MIEKELVVALDVGTTKVCTIISEYNNDELEIVGVGTHPSSGLKKGSVVNIDKTVQSISSSINQAKMMSGFNDIESVSIGIAGNHIYCFNSTGIVAVKGRDITEKDVTSAIEAAKAVLIPSDREVLHVIAQDFKVDSTSGIKDPIGMCGSRLEVRVHIVTGKITLISNLVKCVEMSGLKVDNIVLQPIASSNSVLTEEEKELGVVLVDIGGGTTDIAIWSNESLVHSQIIPIGGNHFTNDLAIALKVPHSEAERIKLNFGNVLKEGSEQMKTLKVQGLPGAKPKEVGVSLVAEVLGARAEQLFEVIQEIIEKEGRNVEINGGMVFTGGGSLISNLPELAEFYFERAVKIGVPWSFGGMTKVMQNPKYSTVLGLLREARVQKSKIKAHSQTQSKKRAYSSDNSSLLIKKFKDSLRNVFREIF